MVVVLFEYHRFIDANIDYEGIYNHTLGQCYLIEEGILGFIDNLLVCNSLSSGFYFSLDRDYINRYLVFDKTNIAKLTNFAIKHITKSNIFKIKANKQVFYLTDVNNTNIRLKLGDIFVRYHTFTIAEKYFIHHLLKTNTTFITTIPNITIEDICIYLNKAIKEHKQQYYYHNNKGIFLEPYNINIPFHNNYYHPFLHKLYSPLLPR